MIRYECFANTCFKNVSDNYKLNSLNCNISNRKIYILRFISVFYYVPK